MRRRRPPRRPPHCTPGSSRKAFAPSVPGRRHTLELASQNTVMKGTQKRNRTEMGGEQRSDGTDRRRGRERERERLRGALDTPSFWFGVDLTRRRFGDPQRSPGPSFRDGTIRTQEGSNGGYWLTPIPGIWERECLTEQPRRGVGVRAETSLSQSFAGRREAFAMSKKQKTRDVGEGLSFRSSINRVVTGSERVL